MKTYSFVGIEPNSKSSQFFNYSSFPFVTCLFLMFIFSQFLLGGNQKISSPEKMVSNIHWFGQAAVKITAMEKTIYIDPYRIKKKDKADIILITHEHRDHFSPEDIYRVATENSIIIAPTTCREVLKDIDISPKIFLQPDEQTEINGIKIEAVPAYNVVKTKFHPKSNEWLGYILTIDGVRIYHAGDTERIPEMKNFKTDIAIMPLGQTYTMNSVKEAAEAALDTKAQIAIPMHFGLYEGTKEDAEQFKKILEDKIKVVILEEE